MTTSTQVLEYCIHPRSDEKTISWQLINAPPPVTDAKWSLPYQFDEEVRKREFIRWLKRDLEKTGPHYYRGYLW